MSQRASIPPPATPRRTIATRVLASFAVTIVAFAITVGFGARSQRQAAADSEELTKGFVPVALKLGQVRAVQTTLKTLVDGSSDDRNPSTRLLLETLVKVRHIKIFEARSAMTKELREFGSDATEELALELAGELDATEASFDGEKAAMDKLFSALDAGDHDTANRVLLSLSATELEGDKRLRALAERVASSMDALGVAAKARERRAIWQLFGLAVLTFAVGIAVSIHTRRLLAPLARMTARAQAVARGDLTPHDPERSEDEIGELSVAFERMITAVARAQNRALSNERLAAIGKMAAHVTHEIRNPLSSIGLNIELLEEELAQAQVPGESRALLGSITREVERLEHLSEEYLRVARLPSPRMEADDVATAVREIAQFARPEMERAGCKLELHIADSVPPALYDEAQLRQALLNLLRNAREAMPNGGEIDLRVESEGLSVLVSVEDRGGGIPEEIRARVFDPFFSTKGEGTGLGLAITRQIVEAHGGTLTCDSRDGGGTIFRVSLPFAPARASGIQSARAKSA